MNVFQLEYCDTDSYPHYRTIGIYHSKEAAFAAIEDEVEIVKEDFHYTYYTAGFVDYRIVKRIVL